MMVPVPAQMRRMTTVLRHIAPLGMGANAEEVNVLYVVPPGLQPMVHVVWKAEGILPVAGQAGGMPPPAFPAASGIPPGGARPDSLEAANLLVLEAAARAEAFGKAPPPGQAGGMSPPPGKAGGMPPPPGKVPGMVSPPKKASI